MFALRDLALGGVVVGVTIVLSLTILAELQTVVYDIEGGAGSAYNATGEVIGAIDDLPSWLTIWIVAGAGIAILGLVMAGFASRRD